MTELKSPSDPAKLLFLPVTFLLLKHVNKSPPY